MYTCTSSASKAPSDFLMHMHQKTVASTTKAYMTSQRHTHDFLISHALASLSPEHTKGVFLNKVLPQRVHSTHALQYIGQTHADSTSRGLATERAAMRILRK